MAGGTASLVSVPRARHGPELAAGEGQDAATLAFAPRNGLLTDTVFPNLSRGPREQGYPSGQLPQREGGAGDSGSPQPD